MSQEIINKYNNLPAVLAAVHKAMENLVPPDREGALREVSRILDDVEAKLIAAIACASLAHEACLVTRIENALDTIKGLKKYVRTLTHNELS